MKNLFIGITFLISIVTFCLFIFSFLNFQSENFERYKIYMHPTYRADQYLLDTKTGIVWQLVQDENKQNMWEPMMKISVTPEDIENATNKYLYEEQRK